MRQKRKSEDLAVTSERFFLYKDKSGRVQVNALFQDETLWLTQKTMAELFEVERSVITKHIRNIFKEGELQEEAVSANFAHTAADGKNYLQQDELSDLRYIVIAFLDFAKYGAAQQIVRWRYKTATHAAIFCGKGLVRSIYIFVHIYPILHLSLFGILHYFVGHIF